MKQKSLLYIVVALLVIQLPTLTSFAGDAKQPFDPHREFSNVAAAVLTEDNKTRPPDASASAAMVVLSPSVDPKAFLRKLESGALADGETLTVGKGIGAEKLARLMKDPTNKSVQLVALNFSAFGKRTPIYRGDAAADYVPPPSKPLTVPFCKQKGTAFCGSITTSGWSNVSDGAQLLTGTLVNGAKQRGKVSFVKSNDGVVLGAIHFPTSVWAFEELSQGVAAAALRENVDRSVDDVATSSQASHTSAPKDDPPNGAADDCDDPPTHYVLDILVRYTHAAADNSYKRGADLRHSLKYATLLANKSLTNSKINGEVHLTSVEEADFHEKASFQSDLMELTSGNGDGVAIRNARRADRADVVVLVVHDDDAGNCGRAAGISVDQQNAYVVVNWQCLLDRFSYIHEVGHLMGAWHDPATVGAAAYVQPPYAYGYIVPGQDPFATIMAYPNSCKKQCGRDWYWANPEIKTDDGNPMGTTTKNFDACVWRRRLPIVSGFDGG